MGIIDNNRLLDVFMESKGEYIPVYDMHGGEVWGDYKPHNYHSDWNLLMDVVEKIENIDEDCNILFAPQGCSITCKEFSFSIDLNTKREAVYIAVVSFIKWYVNKE